MFFVGQAGAISRSSTDSSGGLGSSSSSSNSRRATRTHQSVLTFVFGPGVDLQHKRRQLVGDYRNTEEKLKMRATERRTPFNHSGGPTIRSREPADVREETCQQLPHSAVLTVQQQKRRFLHSDIWEQPQYCKKTTNTMFMF